jgi:pimeloyl-ACP methyl ester carboxylesterase
MFLSCCVLSVASCGQVGNEFPTTNKVEWLIGNWEGTYNAKPFYEAWRKLDDSTLINFTVDVTANDTIVKENGMLRTGKKGSFFRDRTSQWKVVRLTATTIELGNDVTKPAGRIYWSRTQQDHWLTLIKNPFGDVKYDLTRIDWLETPVNRYVSNTGKALVPKSVLKNIETELVITTKDGVKLQATVSKPQATGKLPLIILLHGSGDDTRQNEYYQLLQTKFNEIGFAVLMYDKRGCGSSTGSWIQVPFSVLKDDALEVFRKVNGDSSYTKIGFWGGSEGSCLALWAAAEEPRVNFVVGQSFTAMPFVEQNAYQTNLAITALSKGNAADINARMDVQDLMYRYARTGQGYSDYVAAVNSLRDKPWFSKTLSEPMGAFDPWWKWYKTKMDVSPIRFLRIVKVPVLFVWGALDELVPVEKSYQMVKELSGGKNITYKIFDQAGHNLFTSAGAPLHIGFLQEWLKKVN